MPVEVVATGVPEPLSGDPDAVMPMVTPLALHAWPELTYVSICTSNTTLPPGKTSDAAFE